MVGRILVLNTELSGINKYLFSQLKKRGWELTIVNIPFPKICVVQALVFSFTPNIIKWKYRYQKWIRDLNKNPRTFIKRTRFCQKILKKYCDKYDLIFQISGIFAPILHYKNLHKPYVTFNDYTVALSKKYLDWAPQPSQLHRWLALEKELYENARFIFTTSENTRKSFINDYGIEPKKVIQVTYGATLGNNPNFSKIYGNKIILFVGKDFKRKGGFILLDAFKKIKKEIKDAQLIIIGPNKGSLKIEQPGVHLIGFLKQKDEVNKIYEDASVFIMPSFCEPFGLVFLEAMAYALPCIGTFIDAIPEIIEDGKTGFLIPLGDVDVLVEKMKILLKDEDLAKKMGQEGQKRLNEKFRWENLGEKLDYFLKQCL